MVPRGALRVRVPSGVLGVRVPRAQAVRVAIPSELINLNQGVRVPRTVCNMCFCYLKTSDLFQVYLICFSDLIKF